MSRGAAYKWLSEALKLSSEKCHIGQFSVEQCKQTIQFLKGEVPNMAQPAMANPSTKVVTGKVRFSYPNVFQPRAVAEGQDAKYSVSLLIPKSDKATMSKIKAAMEAVKATCASLFGGKVPANLASPIHDGDAEKPHGGEYGPEAQGCWVLNASSKQKPGIVDADMNAILDSTEFYPGCYGRASINFFAYNKAGNRGIGCGLNNLQKTADGEPLSNRSRPEDDFEEYTDDEDDPLG